MIISFDNTVALIQPEDAVELQAYVTVREQFKAMAPGAQYMQAHKLYLKTKGARGWDGRTSIMSKPHYKSNSGFFPTGMLPAVHTALVSLTKLNITFVDKRVQPSILTPTAYTVPLKGYQVDALDAAIGNRIQMGTPQGFWWPNGVLQIATGGGKTELAVAMCQALPVPTMFIVHRKHLVTQARKRFAKYGIDTGQIGDGVFDPDTQGITVATVQTLDNLFKEGDKPTIDTFIGAEQIFFDEAHLCASKVATGNQLVAVARQFRRAFYRWGLTATPFMKDDYSNQLLMGCTGDRLSLVSNAMLIQTGDLTPPRVQMIHMPDIGKPKGWPEVYDWAIIMNRQRNARIIEELMVCPKPALVMTSRLSHAKGLHNLAIKQGISLPAVQCGATPNKERNQTIADLQSGKEEAIIATTIFDEGVDIPDLRTIILAGGGKSPVAQLQRLGRGLRTNPGKSEVLIIDFDDQTGAVLKRHSKARRKVWEDEGFTIEEKR